MPCSPWRESTAGCSALEPDGEVLVTWFEPPAWCTAGLCSLPARPLVARLPLGCRARVDKVCKPAKSKQVLFASHNAPRSHDETVCRRLIQNKLQEPRLAGGAAGETLQHRFEWFTYTSALTCSSKIEPSRTRVVGAPGAIQKPSLAFTMPGFVSTTSSPSIKLQTVSARHRGCGCLVTQLLLSIVKVRAVWRRWLCSQQSRCLCAQLHWLKVSVCWVQSACALWLR
jgi:hypothetical protein